MRRCARVQRIRCVYARNNNTLDLLQHIRCVYPGPTLQNIRLLKHIIDSYHKDKNYNYNYTYIIYLSHREETPPLLFWL